MTTTIQVDQNLSDAVVNGIGRVTIGDMLRRSALRFAAKPAIIERHRTTTYQELDRAANKIARWLLDRGLPQGSRVATFCVNSAAYMAAIFGTNRSGHVWVPMNLMLPDDDIAHILRHSEARVILVDRDRADRIAPLLVGLDITVLTIDPDDTDLLSSQLASYPDSEPEVRIHERDVAFIMYTSGTTAKAKGVMHCHLAVVITLLSNIGEWTVTREDRILIGLPLFHIAGHTMVSTLLAAGGTVVLHRGFDAGHAVADIQHHRVTMLFALPMMYDAMLATKRNTGADTSSLRFCIYAMAPMARNLLEALITEFCPSFALTSGQTEIYPMTVMFRPEQQLQRFGNYWGESSAIDDTAIMDDNGAILPDGEVGEIVHRGPNVMIGYFNDPDATADAQKYGWHHTGDLGYFDPDGQLVFADRKKDMIKSGGENVPSVLVEEVILRHPAVSNAVAIGLPHPRWSEAIFVCVQCHPGAKLVEDDLFAHARAHLGGFQVPKGFAILEALPMTATGKARKVELREQFRTYFLDHSES